MKKLLLTVVMLVFGFGSLIGFAAVVKIRESRPIPVTFEPTGGGAAETAHGALLAMVRHVRDALDQGGQTEAVYALDAAIRAASVAEHAVPEDRDAAFGETWARLEEAGRAIQNGRRQRALDRLDEAVKTLQSEADVAGVQLSAPAVGRRDDYRGATLIDPRGLRIGEVVELRGEGDGLQAVVRTRSPQNVFGFIDFEGPERTVPASELLFGMPKTIGSTLVMWATPDSE